MSIRFTWKGKVYELNIGYKTFWYEQNYLISFNRLYFCYREVVKADSIWHSKPRRQS